MKLCKNCKHFALAEGIKDLELGHCGHEWPVSLVSGIPLPIPDLPYCSTKRRPSGACGLEASQYVEMESLNV